MKTAPSAPPDTRRRRTLLRCAIGLVFVAIVASLTGPDAVWAQDPDTAARSARVDRDRREYIRRSYRKITRLLEEWSTAWEKGSMKEMAECYSNRAVVHFPGTGRTVWGQEAVLREAPSALPIVEEASVQVADFGLYNRLAFVFGYHSYRTVEDVPDGGEETSGTFLATFRREGRNWRIRTHLFRLTGR